MQIFISWSGERSRQLALCLHDWIPNVLQNVKPWMSEEDIEKGARWSPEIAGQLEASNVGVICLTPENQSADWLLFESGALSKTLDATYVCPYLLGLKPAEVSGPLGQFQCSTTGKVDTRKLIKTINRAQKEALPEERLKSIFEKWWPDLNQALKKIPKSPSQPAPPTSDRQMLDEILNTVRSISRHQSLESVLQADPWERKVVRMRPDSPRAETTSLIDYLTKKLQDHAAKKRDTSIEEEPPDSSPPTTD